MNDEYRKLNQKIVDHYGVRAQAKYMMTEVYELIEAMLEVEFSTYEYILFSGARTHIAEEIADVYVFLDQFCSCYGIKWDDVKRIAERKIERQTERIKKEIK